MQKVKKHPVNALDNVVKPKKEVNPHEYKDVPIELDDYQKVLDYVSSGDYNAAREYLDTLDNDARVYIKTHVALKTQVML